jgi:hypothetical protein
MTYHAHLMRVILLFYQCSACKLVFNTSLWQAVIDCVEKFSWLRNVCSCCSYCWTLWSSAVKINRKGRGDSTKYVYIKSTTVYVPSSKLVWPLSRKRVCPPSPRTKGWGAHSMRLSGWGSPNSDDWRKSLALCLLCDVTHAVRGIGIIQIEMNIQW